MMMKMMMMMMMMKMKMTTTTTTMMMIMTMIMMMVFITHITRNIGIYLDREVNENAKLSLLYGESCSIDRFFNTPNQMHIILYICYIYIYIFIYLFIPNLSYMFAALLVGRARDRFLVVSLDFSVTCSFRPYHGPGVDLAPSENEHQEHFLGVQGAGA